MMKLSAKFPDRYSSDNLIEIRVPIDEKIIETRIKIKGRLYRITIADIFRILLIIIKANGIIKLIDSGKERLSEKVIVFLPEDYRGELQALRERWAKMNYSPQRIKWLNYKHIFLGFLCLIQVKIENLRLPTRGASKEIE